MEKGKTPKIDKQKVLQREFSDKIFRTYFTEGKGPYRESLIGDFIDYYTLTKAISLIPFNLKGRKVLSICCGDGPEGEYLYKKLGAQVTVTDISPEAIKAAKRRCPNLKGLVADSENLPFKDDNFDMVLVRHGLHHLENPYKGIYEMGRVGKKGFVFIEAQKNFITKILIWLGLALEHEESGNFVYRFSRREVIDLMNRMGIKKYKIYTCWCYHVDFLTENVYPLLNKRIFFIIFLIFFKFFNLLFGYFGNSMTVVAIKD